MQKIYTNSDLALLHLLQSKLATEGIPCTIKNSYPPAAGEITPSVAWPELWVLNDDLATQAEQFIQHELEQQQHQLQDTSTWQCPQCSESLEQQFKLCWKCGYTRTAK